jgi:hypothetical protein
MKKSAQKVPTAPKAKQAEKDDRSFDGYGPVFDAAEAIAKREGLPNIGAVFNRAMKIREKSGRSLRLFKGNIVKTNPRKPLAKTEAR